MGISNLSVVPNLKNDVFAEIFPSFVRQMQRPLSKEGSPPSFDPAITSRFETLLFRGGSPSVGSTQYPDSNFLQSVRTDLQNKIDTPEPEIRERLNQINSDRAAKAKAPIDFEKTTHEIESIVNDNTLSDKQKKDKIGELRKQLGLSKKDMKKLFTKRLGKIYQQAADQIKYRLKQLKDSVKEAEKIYGKNSPEANAAHEKLKAAQTQLEPTLQQWQHQASLYQSMFPSFWSKIGGFFKKIGKGLLKVGKVFSKIMNFVTPFLRFIPGIGQMIAVGWGALQGLYQAFKGNLRGLLGGCLSFARGIPGIGNIVSAISSATSKVFPTIRGVCELALRNLGGFLQSSSSLIEKIPGITPFLSKTSEYLSYLISPLRSKPDPLEEGIPPGTVG